MRAAPTGGRGAPRPGPLGSLGRCSTGRARQSGAAPPTLPHPSAGLSCIMTRARVSWVLGAKSRGRERALPQLLGPSPAPSSSSSQGRREGKYLGWAEGLRSRKFKVKPIIKLPDAGVLPDLSCSGPAQGQLSIRSAARNPKRGFKCQACRKPAPGGSARELASPAGPAGPSEEKLNRAQPCLWAGAQLGICGCCLGKQKC